GGCKVQFDRCVVPRVIDDIQKVRQGSTGRRDGEGRQEGDGSNGSVRAIDHVLGLGAEDGGCVEKVKVIVDEILDGLRKSQRPRGGEDDRNLRCVVGELTFYDKSTRVGAERMSRLSLDVALHKKSLLHKNEGFCTKSLPSFLIAKPNI